MKGKSGLMQSWMADKSEKGVWEGAIKETNE